MEKGSIGKSPRWKQPPRRPRSGRGKPPLGRPCTLDVRTEDLIIKTTLEGHTLGVACRAAGISRRTFYLWLEKARRGLQPYADFAAKLQTARDDARTVVIKTAPRHLARARYEQGPTADELIICTFKEIMRMIREGRVPHAVAIRACEMAQDELNDVLVDESVSYSPTLAKTFGIGYSDSDLE